MAQCAVSWLEVGSTTATFISRPRSNPLRQVCNRWAWLESTSSRASRGKRWSTDDSRLLSFTTGSTASGETAVSVDVGGRRRRHGAIGLPVAGGRLDRSDLPNAGGRLRTIAG